MPGVARGDVVVEIGEGVSEECKDVTVALEDTPKVLELPPAPDGELHFWSLGKLLEVSIPWQANF